MRISNRVAIVTGSSRGIGAAIAKVLAREGAVVVVNYLKNKGKALEILNAIRRSGGKGIAVGADISVRSDVDRMAQIVIKEFGKVDILVNNAHRDFTPKRFLDLKWEDFQSQVDGTIKGVFNCCQAVLPGMIERKWGRIINIGSITVDQPELGFHTRDAAKAALIGLTRDLALEVAPYGITVNVVSPGWTLTDQSSKFPKELRLTALKRTPLGQLARPEDIAEAILFLASEESRFITGVSLPVCGGAIMK